MNYSKIKYYDIANGPGIRTSLFVSGCNLHCKGCFNREAWDFNSGDPFTIEVQTKVIESLRSDYISGLTVLGGEPFEPRNQTALFSFFKKVRSLTSSCKSIWVFSGHTWNELTLPSTYNVPSLTSDMLNLVDVLVDGPFIQSKYDISLRFKGSSNQRIIDVRKSLINNKVVLWQDKDIYNFH